MGTSPSNTLSLSVSDPSGYEYGVSFEPESFAEGQHRKCYIGTLINEKAPKHNKNVVLKVFKPHYVDTFAADYECVKDLEKSIICHEVSIKFNKSMENYREYTMPISFPAPLRINIKRGKQPLINHDKDFDILVSKVFNCIPINIANHKYLTVQLYLKNSDSYKYSKLSSNNGWMDKSSEYAFLSAFTHYSWMQSKGKSLITGFQGIQRGHVLFLSDAVIHSDKIGKHGNTDLGIIGIINFFMNHECTECCKHLSSPNMTLLIDYLSQHSILSVNESNCYIFDLNTTEIKKDEGNIETVYNQSIQQTFSLQTKETEKEKQKQPQVAGNAGDETSNVVIADKMEQIEHVVEEMNNKQDDIENNDHDHVVEEEEEEEFIAAVETIDSQQSDESDDGDIIIEEEEEEEEEYDDDVEEEDDEVIEIINPNVDVSWFGDDDDDHESYAEQKDIYDLDAANFVDIQHDINDQEHNEWELVN